MIRMIQSSSAGHAKAYFSDALLKSDYYTNDQELTGYWQGKLANRLGLQGATTKEAFFALCENLHPVTGDHLTLRTREGRTTGYDINFHCPKSVSVIHAFAKDDHILHAFQESVNETMKVLEGDSKTRVRKNGQYDDRQTSELIWSHFVHQTARPVEGLSPDPHLHSHCFVFNATWDDTEKQFKAGQFKDIKRDMPFYQAQFHKTFADKLMNLGYAIRLTDKSFEIENVPKNVIDLFSKRTDEIGRIAKEKGITGAKQLDALGSRTRAKKQKGISMEELKEEWRAQMNALPKESGEGDKIVRHATKQEVDKMNAKACVDHALEHCFERASVMTDRRLLQTAFRHSLGNMSVSISDINQCFKDDARIIHVTENSRTLCTTKAVLSEEKRMVDLARAGQGKLLPLYQKAPKLTLKGQQADAVAYILTNTHQVSIIRGSAGTGKTTLMTEAKEKINEAGKQLIVVAPTAQASRGVLKSEGFDKADTVAKLLTDAKMQADLKGQVLWVDEAGLLGTSDMVALLELSKTQNARLILGGDTRQHASVVRGDALRILNTVAGIKTAEVSKIYRQKNEAYRSAVEDLSKGNVARAFEKLEDIGAIKNVCQFDGNKQLVNDYIEVIKKGKIGLVISPTHAQGEAVTEEIRKRMKEEKFIGKKEIAAKQYVALNFTEAEKKDFRNYEAEQLIQFEQNAHGFQRGSQWLVAKTDKKSVHVKNNDGERKILPLHQANRFSVFEERKINLAKGDLVRITHNGFDSKEKRFNNGDIFEVASVSKKGNIILQNKKSRSMFSLDKNFGHIAHAHCITSYASQGKTVDEVFISQPAATFGATDAKQFYVSVSRAKERARIYTDDKEMLLQYGSELGERQSAIELLDIHHSHKNILMRMELDEQNSLANKLGKRVSHSQKQREDYEPEL